MINYSIQVILFQLLFLAVYDLFLNKETFFKWNRVYLLITPILSFIIPWLKMESIQKSIPQEYMVYLPEVVINPQVVFQQTTSLGNNINYISIIFWSGVVVFTMIFIFKLFKIIRLILSNKVIKKETYSLVILKDKKVAFSFFNYIFINENLLKSNDLQIIQHELIHCKQKHSIDLLVFEILKTVQWFNPIIYLFQKRITVLHEYLSDEAIVNQTNAKSYFNKLLSETFNVENITFINQFYKHSLIKKRIVMITKNKSQKIKQLKYLLIIPLLFGMLIYSSCTDDSSTNFKDVETLIQKKNIESNGFYFEGNNGLKLFTGNSLEGKIIPYNKMTKTEKVIYDKFKLKDYKGIDLQVVIDKNNQRVIFIKMDRKLNGASLDTKVKVESNNDVPYSIVDKVPVYPGCSGDQTTLRKCLQENISNYINKNFNADLANHLNLQSGVKRIFVLFTINKEGIITGIRARAPHIKLEEEAIRVIKLLPKMIPGKENGENVGVKYSLPIAFNVEDKNQKQKNVTLKDIATKNQPIYILNGKEISKEEMSKIDPKSIKSMNVLKGESAIKKYGEEGKNGVIEIIKIK
jgi:hypothetical protein